MVKIFNYMLEGKAINFADKEFRDIKYINKNTFDKAVEDGLEYRIVGRTALKEISNNDNQSAVFVDNKKYLVDAYKFRFVKGYIPVGDDRYLEFVGLPFFILLIPLLAVLGLILGIGFIFSRKPNAPLTPNWSVLPTETATESTDTLIIDLPTGYCQYDGKLDAFSGNTLFVVKATIDNSEHVLVNQSMEVNDGKIAPWNLDFLIQDVELVPGFYEGYADITGADGSTETHSVQVIIRQNNTGNVEFSYTHDVTIDTSTGEVSVYYESAKNSTHDTAIQIILLNEGKEYLLAQSGKIARGQKVTSLQLNSDMAPLISSGVYTGYIRLFFNADLDDYSTTSLYTDVEAFITVK